MTMPAPEKRVQEFEKLGFGMFIHWGLYSQLSQGEWTLELHQIPKAEYDQCYKNFTAADFDAEKIVAKAKQAGMKYITLTTRHHDGFSLYDTRGLNEYDAPHSPCKRDLIKEFTDACHEADILPILYHTTLDWIHPDFDKDFDSYLEYLRQSIEILCTYYGRIGGFWFDGNWSKRDADWKEDELYGMIRKLQPDAMIICNSGLSKQGEAGHPLLDSVTFEQGRAEPMQREGMKKYLAAEMCQTMNHHWGVADADLDYKSPRQLIETLCHARKVGANYLLNVGLEGQGAFNKYQEAMLDIIGKWTNMAKETLYDGELSTVTSVNKDFVLEKNGKAYIYVHDLPIIGHKDVTAAYANQDQHHALYHLDRKVKSIHWLDNKEELNFTQNLEEASLTYRAMGFTYGSHWIVRIAEIEFE